MTSHPPNRGPKNPGSNPPPTEIRAAREAAGLTQTEAGALIYSSARTWQNWEAPPGVIGIRAEKSRRIWPPNMAFPLLR